jgi:hypothetical protein
LDSQTAKGLHETSIEISKRAFGYMDTGTWTQELRVAGNKTEGFRWIGGVYFEPLEPDSVTNFKINGNEQKPLFNGLFYKESL